MAARKKVSKKARSTKKPARPSAAKAKAKKSVKAKAPAAKAKKAPAKAKAKAKKAPAKAKAKATKAPAKAKKAPAKAKAKAKAPAARAPAKAKAPAAKAPAAKAKANTLHAPRRDATGHLNPKYAADLRARSRESHEDLGSESAFLVSSSRSRDTLAEELGEDAVSTMTSGEDQSERLQDLEVEEERGGPFVRTTARQEYGLGTDKSNPRDATREPFPTT